MVSEETYELCLSILDNEDENEEEKVEKLESFLRDKTSLTNGALENAVLDVLWRHRNSTLPDTSAAPLRHTVIRRSSPAPWQMGRCSTPLSPPSNTGSSPVTASGFPVPRGGFPRPPKSLTASPFTSPRPSPRLALVQPIPHSPNLSTYEFSDRSPAPDIYGDFGSDTVDWLVNEDAKSQASSAGLSAAAPEWIAPPDMGPYDILRSVLGERKTNEEIEQALEVNGYDLGATIAALTEQGDNDAAVASSNEGRVLVGKSMTVDQMRPVTPSGPNRNPVVCKYWLSTGQCLRADCRFSHDLTSHICKYWLMGNCLAGESCPFSHNPSALIGNMGVGNEGIGTGNPVNLPGGTPPPYAPQNNYDSFPALQPAMTDQWQNNYQAKQPVQYMMPGNHQTRPGSSHNYRNKNNALNHSSRSQSRPTSQHQNRDSHSSAPAVDDPEAFPTLSALNVRGSGKKQHGKRGGHHRENNKHRENSTGSLADVIRMSPSSSRRGTPKGNRSSMGSNREISAAAQAIPTPKHIPWLETGVEWNQQYLKYRLDAITHGNVRNKFLQSAAQAWNRTDARAAKALSLRGQAENDAMRRCHREAARLLYEEGNKHISENDNELYADFHGLLPGEAIDYLHNILKENAQANRQLLYAITGSGHHSKNGKDKTGKAIKGWLNDYNYVYREFSVPGERGGFVALVLGIDPTSSDRNLPASKANGGQDENSEPSMTAQKREENGNNPTLTGAPTSESAPVLTMGKVQLLKREDPSKKS